MSEASIPHELIDYLQQSSRLTREEAQKLVGEVFAYCHEVPSEYVVRRHAELKREGWANADIFSRVAAELAGRRFAAEPLSERQIRRLIYG